MITFFNYSTRKRAINVIKWAAVILLLFWTLLPIYWIFVTSLKTRIDIFTIPPKTIFTPTLDAYRELLRPTGSLSILDNMRNSIVVALITTILVILIGSLAAYSLSRYRFTSRSTFMYGILGSRLLPPITAIVPLFLMMNSLKLVDTVWGLILIYTALDLPFAIWMLKSYFDSISIELEEAALIDGSSRLGALRYVTVPLAAPGMAATAIFAFVLAWNEFMFAFIFTSVRSQTMPVVISKTVGEMQTYWGRMAAEAVLVMLPVLFFTFFLQRHMVKGLSAGALK